MLENTFTNNNIIDVKFQPFRCKMKNIVNVNHIISTINAMNWNNRNISPLKEKIVTIKIKYLIYSCLVKNYCDHIFEKLNMYNIFI
jgi:hypothetical protein